MRPSLTRGIVYGLLFSLPVWTALLWAMHAYGDEPAKPATKLTGWVHVIGCPHTSKVTGQNYVVLIFSDGESVAIDINKQDDTQRANLSAFIGGIEGYTYVAKCEMAT